MSTKGDVEVNRIRELRNSHKMTQAKLAKLLKIAPTAVSKYELGQLEIDSNTINALCDIFGCASDYLLCRSSVPDAELTPEEESLLAAWRKAPPEIRAIIDAALAPYRKDTASSTA